MTMHSPRWGGSPERWGQALPYPSLGLLPCGTESRQQLLGPTALPGQGRAEWESQVPSWDLSPCFVSQAASWQGCCTIRRSLPPGIWAQLWDSTCLQPGSKCHSVPSAFPEHGGQCTASDVTFRVRDSRPGCWVPEGQEEKGQGEGRGASSLAQPSSLPRGSPALGTCPPCVPIGAATVRRAGPMAGLLSYLEA